MFPYPCLPVTLEFMSMSMLSQRSWAPHPSQLVKGFSQHAIQARAGNCICICACLSAASVSASVSVSAYAPAPASRTTLAAPAVCICNCNCGALELLRWGSCLSVYGSPVPSPPMYLCPQSAGGILDGLTA